MHVNVRNTYVRRHVESESILFSWVVPVKIDENFSFHFVNEWQVALVQGVDAVNVLECDGQQVVLGSGLVQVFHEIKSRGFGKNFLGWVVGHLAENARRRRRSAVHLFFVYNDSETRKE